MTPWIVAVVAGLVQGVVEWLPVSSKTMITLAFAAGGYRLETGYVMGLLANFGSFFAALWYFRRDVAAAVSALAHPFSADRASRLLRYLVLATLATGAVGLPVYAGVTTAFTRTTGAYAMVGIGLLLLVTGAVGRVRERLAAAAPTAAEGDVPGPWASLLVGAFQGLAALPGISRSAVTVTPLLWLGQPAAQALRLSFLLDVPALLAAGAVPLVLGHRGLSAVAAVGIGPTLAMVAVSAVTSLVVIGAVLGVAARLRSSVIAAAIGVITIAAGLVAYLH
ncbi:MAG: undecaprenyl-diphosphate phosphatase [Firmicutes bacterium]|nr:undecaprenyl-diphosphate phosphatase [Bacillota bacterium]